MGDEASMPLDDHTGGTAVPADIVAKVKPAVISVRVRMDAEKTASFGDNERYLALEGKWVPPGIQGRSISKRDGFSVPDFGHASTP